MKNIKYRFVVFCAILMFLLFLPVPTLSLRIPYEAKDITYFFYAKQPSQKINADVINCGAACIVSCSANQAKEIKSKLQDIQGESIRIRNYTSDLLTKIMLDYFDFIVKQESVDNMTIYYFYDSKLPKFVNIDGKKINLQMAISQSEINIGYPLILNGY